MFFISLSVFFCCLHPYLSNIFDSSSLPSLYLILFYKFLDSQKLSSAQNYVNNIKFYGLIALKNVIKLFAQNIGHSAIDSVHDLE